MSFLMCVRSLLVIGACALSSAAPATESIWAKVTVVSSGDLPAPAGWSKTVRAGKWLYQRDIVQTVPSEGRDYPSVVVTTDAAAIDVRPFSDAFASVGSPCDAVRLEESALTCTYRAGFLVLAKAREASVHIDQTFSGNWPAWISERLTWARGYFAQRLGEKSRPLVLVYPLPWVEGTCGTLGGVRDGLMLLGISRGCLQGNHRGALEHFLAHETFHLWNVVLTQRAADDPWAMMTLEGGAEWAADVAVTDNQPVQALASELADHVFSCQASMAGDTRSAYAVVRAQPTVAYSCGAVYVFEKSIEGGRGTSARDQFFAWVRGRLASTDASSGPRNSASDPAPEGSVEAMYRAGGNWLEATASWMAKQKVRVVLDGPVSASQAHRLHVDIVRDVLRNDCQGHYGLYTDGIPRIDPGTKGCRTMSPGGQPVSLSGVSIAASPMAAARAWQSACASKAEVTIGYLDRRPDSTPRCRKDGIVPLRPVAIAM